MQLLVTTIGAGLVMGCLLFLVLAPDLPRAEAYPPSLWTVQKSGVKDDLKAVRFVTAEMGWAVGSANTILHTKDGGKTWVRQIPRDANGWTFDNVLFTSPKVGWTRTNIHNKILRTTDGGASWQDLPIPDKSVAGKCFNSHAAIGSSYFLQAGSAVFRTNNGKKWIKLNNNFAATTGGWSDMSFADKDHGCIVLGNGLVAMTADGGKSWKQQKIKTPPSNYMKIQFIDVKTGWVIPQYGTIHATVDGGKTWQPQKLRDVESGSQVDMQFVSAKVGHVLVGHIRGYAVRQTKDGGDTWQELEVMTLAPSYVNGLSFPDADHGWVVGDKGFIARYQAPSR